MDRFDEESLLSAIVATWGPFGAHAEVMRTLLGEVKRLQRWKDEATKVLEDWGAVWEAAGRPGALGGTKSLGVMAELARLEEECATMRSALALAVGELSGHPPHTGTNPAELLEWLMREARYDG